MTTKTQKPTPVCITRCAHCGLERSALKPITTNCPQCDRGEAYQYHRWIAEPHPDTLAEATSPSRYR